MTVGRTIKRAADAERTGKTIGTRVVEKYRPKMNQLTEAERKQLLEVGLPIIYHSYRLIDTCAAEFKGFKNARSCPAHLHAVASHLEDVLMERADGAREMRRCKNPGTREIFSCIRSINVNGSVLAQLLILPSGQASGR